MTKNIDKLNPATEKPWYNRPLIGEETLLEIILGSFYKKKVPQEAIKLHQNIFQAVYNQSGIVQQLDDAKFTNPEFVFYIKLILSIKKGAGQYSGLAYNYELLSVAFATKESFIKLEEIEFKYRARKQQELYTYVEKMLEENLSTVDFKREMKEKIASIRPNLQTQEGILAVNSYEQALEKISDSSLGLKLLARFKKYEMSNFTILRKLGEFVDSLTQTDIKDLTNFELIVRTNQEVFQRLGKIIEIPANKNKSQTYAQMMQYITLGKKHEYAYPKFQSLVSALLKWEEFYLKLLPVRQTYIPKKYKQPREFREEIPGLNIYKKYQEYLEIVSQKLSTNLI